MMIIIIMLSLILIAKKYGQAVQCCSLYMYVFYFFVTNFKSIFNCWCTFCV